MGFLICLFKGACFILFCLLSGFVAAFGKQESNIKKYYAFTALCIVGVILII
jgi:hypothetical protein